MVGIAVSVAFDQLEHPDPVGVRGRQVVRSQEPEAADAALLHKAVHCVRDRVLVPSGHHPRAMIPLGWSLPGQGHGNVPAGPPRGRWPTGRTDRIASASNEDLEAVRALIEPYVERLSIRGVRIAPD